MHTLGKAHLVDFVVGMKGSFCQVASLLGNSKAKISVVNGRCQVLGGRAWGVCAERRRSMREETDENVMCKCDIWGWDDVCGGGRGVAVRLRKALLFRICLPRVNPSEFRCEVGVLRNLSRGKPCFLNLGVRERRGK